MDILNTLWNAIEPILVSVLSFVCNILGAFFFWLPNDPFSGAIESFSSFVSANSTAFAWLNWFVPVGMCASLFSVIVTACIAWVGYMLATRVFDWIRQIKQTINPGG